MFTIDAIIFGNNILGNVPGNSSKTNSVLTELKKYTGDIKVSVKVVTFMWNKTYVLLENNQLFVFGMVGGRMKIEERKPVTVDGTIKKIVGSNHYELFLMEDGMCYKYVEDQDTWTDITNYFFMMDQALDSESNACVIADIVASDTLHMVLTKAGHVFNIPVHLEFPLRIIVKKVACGVEHTVCLTDRSSVYVWGTGTRGQLGNGCLETITKPELLSFLDGLILMDIDAGGWHSAAVTVCGDVYTWGWNNCGQLGFRLKDTDINEYLPTVYSEPKLVVFPNLRDIDVKQVSCGSRHTLVLTSDGLVFACGWNKYGQVNPHSKDEYIDQMVTVPVPNNVIEVKRVYCDHWNSALIVRRKLDSSGENFESYERVIRDPEVADFFSVFS